MSLTADDIIKVMKAAKEMGLIDSEKSVIPSFEPKAEDIVAPLSLFDQVSEDEILYWSSPYYDELQAQKEEKQQRLQDEVRE
jgi:hypothetical protein